MSVSALPPVARRRLASLRIYQPGSAAVRPAGKLSSNEAPLGPAPAVRSAIAASGLHANRYPSDAALTAAVAASEGVGPEQVVVTNGSDELCYLVAALFVEPGARVVLSEPSYQIDELVTRLQQGVPAFVPLRPDGGHDLEALGDAAADGASLVWLPTPHNPTGVAVDPDALETFLGRVPPDCLVVLDEAYRAYLDPPLRPDSRRLIGEHPNLLVQRTFSKSYALAGLRIGYGLGGAQLIAAIAGIRPPFSVSTTALAAAEAALANPAWRDYAVELVRRERDRLVRTLSELGIEHFSSQANFVTVRVADSARLHRAMSAAELAVRDGADLGFDGWIRISIGAPPEMASVRRVLREVCG
jgi:histidinol-phosphate aminotransferase